MSAELKQRTVRHVKAVDRVVRVTVALGKDCAHCFRESLTVSQHGVVSWLSPHAHEAHANSTTMLDLNRVYISIASPKDLRLLIEAAQEQLERVA